MIWNMSRNTVGHEIWRETLEKVENEKQTLLDLEYVEKYSKKRGK